MEQRLHPRVKEVLHIEYETPVGWKKLGETFNLSQGGIGIQAETVLSINRPIHWRLPHEKIKAKGRIVWIDTTRKNYGIQILEIDPLSRNRLAQQINLNDAF